MQRFHVHCVPTDAIWAGAYPVITVTINADDADAAERMARALLDASVYVQEIEEIEGCIIPSRTR